MIENSVEPMDLTPLQYILRKNMEEEGFPWNCIFAMKHDMEMERGMKKELRRFFFQRGIMYSEWERSHIVRKEDFLTKRHKILTELDYLTMKIVRDPHHPRVSCWKKKKELKLKRLDFLLNQGLYTITELADIFGMDRLILRRRLLKIKNRWSRFRYPKDFQPSAKVA